MISQSNIMRDLIHFQSKIVKSSSKGWFRVGGVRGESAGVVSVGKLNIGASVRAGGGC